MNTNQNQEEINTVQDFKIRTFRVNLPKWLQILDHNDEIIVSAVQVISNLTAKVKHLRDNKPAKAFSGNEFFVRLDTVNVDNNLGIISYEFVPQPDLYYKVLSKLSGVEISDETKLVSYVKSAQTAKTEYDKIKSALDDARNSGYGVVVPEWESYQLEEPALHKSGKNFGVKMRVNAESLHIIKVGVKCEVSPIIGSEEQSKEMLNHLQSEYAANQETVWNTPIFGKSLESIVREDLSNKSVSMPVTAQAKMRSALTKIVNNGKGGVICILL